MALNPSGTLHKFGKLAVRVDNRTLNILKYIDYAKLTDIPVTYNWGEVKKTGWGQLQNKKLNNCTCAAAGHMIKCWTANATLEYNVTDKEIIAAYILLTGYNPKTGENDIGACAFDALKFWRKTGIAGHKIKAYATVDSKDRKAIKSSIFLFGGLYIGIQLPISIAGKHIWNLLPGDLTGDNAVGSYGGHAINALAYDEHYITCVSWGKKIKMTWDFFDAYADEVYAIITEDFFDGSKTPSGLDMNALKFELNKITEQKKTLAMQLSEYGRL